LVSGIILKSGPAKGYVMADMSDDKLQSETAPQAAPQAASGQKRKILLGLFGAIGLALVWQFGSWLLHGRFMVTTDDAYVRADMAVLAAKVPGYVAEVKVSDNQMVKQGDVLVRIDDGDYQLALASSEARHAAQQAAVTRLILQVEAQGTAIEQAEAALRAAEGDVVRSAADLERAQKLASNDYGSRQRFDQALADDVRARANLASAKAGIHGAELALQVLKAQRAEAEAGLRDSESAVGKAKRDLDFATIRAPFSGMIGNRAAQPGQYVQPGSRLMALVPLESVYVEANYKETQLAKLTGGLKAQIVVDAYPGRVFEGHVQGVAAASGALFSLLPPENATGNFTKIVQRFPVRITLDVPDDVKGVLRPGMSVVATIDSRR
jgi:membrane fusion protein (multidrug efflux system)